MSSIVRMEGNSLNKELLDANMRHFLPSKRLFCDKKGNSMKFRVLKAPDRDVIVQLIKVGGGVVVDEGASEDSDAVTISSGPITTGKREDVISSSYIYISCFYGALISLEECRLIPDGSDDGDTISEEYGTDKLKTGMSVEEMHQLLVYLRNNERLWKEVAKKKVCGNWSWKSVQQDFTIWALKRFKDMVSVCPETECGSDTQEQSKAGSREENLPTCSRACSDAGHRTKSGRGEGEAERRQGGASEGCDEGAKSGNREEAQAQTLGNEEEISEECVSDSEEEEDISSSTLRKRVAGRQSVVIDDASMSEEEENTSRASKVKNNGISEGGKGRVDCTVGKQVDGLRHMAVDEGDASKEQENVMSVALEANNGGPSRNDRGRDEDCVVQYEKIAMRKVKAKGVLGRNYSVPCNQWLRKDDAWGSIGEVATSTPVSRASNESESGSSDEEGEAGNGSGERSKPANDTTSKRTIPYHQRLYSYKEDMRILMWLCCKRKRGFDSLKGNRIWQFMESKSVVPGRSWQSLRERFRRHIIPNLNSYQIPPEEKKKLLRQFR